MLEKKDFAYITVKEICEKAGVNRSTFYLHYETIGDLLAESIEYMHKKFLSYFSDLDNSVVNKFRFCPEEEPFLVTSEYLTPYLTFVVLYRRSIHITDLPLKKASNERNARGWCSSLSGRQCSKGIL